MLVKGATDAFCFGNIVRSTNSCDSFMTILECCLLAIQLPDGQQSNLEGPHMAPKYRTNIAKLRYKTESVCNKIIAPFLIVKHIAINIPLARDWCLQHHHTGVSQFIIKDTRQSDIFEWYIKQNTRIILRSPNPSKTSVIWFGSYPYDKKQSAIHNSFLSLKLLKL